jgi:hypothetical protein
LEAVVLVVLVLHQVPLQLFQQSHQLVVEAEVVDILLHLLLQKQEVLEAVVLEVKQQEHLVILHQFHPLKEMTEVIHLVGVDMLAVAVVVLVLLVQMQGQTIMELQEELVEMELQLL